MKRSSSDRAHNTGICLGWVPIICKMNNSNNMQCHVRESFCKGYFCLSQSMADKKQKAVIAIDKG